MGNHFTLVAEHSHFTLRSLAYLTLLNDGQMKNEKLIICALVLLKT
jgi:hypothetical protein